MVLAEQCVRSRPTRQRSLYVQSLGLIRASKQSSITCYYLARHPMKKFCSETLLLITIRSCSLARGVPSQQPNRSPTRKYERAKGHHADTEASAGWDDRRKTGLDGSEERASERTKKKEAHGRSRLAIAIDSTCLAVDKEVNNQSIRQQSVYSHETCPAAGPAAPTRPCGR